MNRLHPLSAVTMALQRGLTGFSVPVFLVGMGVQPLRRRYRFAVRAGPDRPRRRHRLRNRVLLSGSPTKRRRTPSTSHRASSPAGLEKYRTAVSRTSTSRRACSSGFSGLAVVSVETAGGGETEAMLNYVSEGEAERLRAEIRRLTPRRTTKRALTSARAPADGDDSATDVGERGRQTRSRDEGSRPFCSTSSSANSCSTR